METLLIKNMVCSRCLMVIDQVLNDLKITEYSLNLGKVVLFQKITIDQKAVFKKKIENLGFEILSKEEDKFIEKIKSLLIKTVRSGSENDQKNLSEIISDEFSRNYNQLSKFFSESEGKTIERYFIELKIEKVKELIRYENFSISEISYELGYSSPQHLSKQFKQITGMTTSDFKKNGERLKLDKL